MNLKPKQMLDFFVKTLNGMALGLFATLIIGVIIGQFGTLLGFEPLTRLAGTLRSLMGMGIGVGVAFSLKLTGLKLIVAAAAGAIATATVNDPVVAYLTVIGTIFILTQVLRKTTPVDILLIPLLGSLTAFGISELIAQPVSLFMQSIGTFIDTATTFQPFIMGIIIAVIMGMALTAPISSAAIAISIGLSGLAAGAALVGGATQMIGFAVMSRKDNSLGVVLSIAFGTSMLQFKNILQKPVIWLPTIITSALLGPVSTLLFKMETLPAGAGMGTSGLIGQITTLDAMPLDLNTLLGIGLLHFALPIILVLGLDLFFRHKKWIKPGDLKLSTQ